MRSITFIACLTALTAGPVAAQGWSAAVFGGFGSGDAYKAGGGVAVGRTLGSGFYVGARAALHGGGSGDIEVETSSTTREDLAGEADIRYIAFEWGRTLVDSSVHLRLTSLLGLASIGQATDAPLPSGATLDDPRSALILGPGLTLDIPFGGLFIGGEARVLNVTDFQTFAAYARLGFRL